MRKTLVLIFAVAILGGLSVYINKHKDGGFATATARPSSAQASTSAVSFGASSAGNSLSLKDGTFSGNAAETPYGTVQVAAVISGGKITDVEFLQMPTDEQHSREVTAMSEPLLKESAISKQRAQGLDMVSGATSTYYGYQESLQAALNKAKLS
jgi:uncharacterized protein with FMN-binding domain